MNSFQRRNRAKLALFLKDLKPSEELKFNMSNYAFFKHEPGYPVQLFTPEDIARGDHPCGTSCCAAGFAPLAGIEPLPGENYSNYISRTLCTGASNGILAPNWSHEWHFLFAADWPNDPSFAADRLAASVLTTDPDFDYLKASGYANPSHWWIWFNREKLEAIANAPEKQLDNR